MAMMTANLEARGGDGNLQVAMVACDAGGDGSNVSNGRRWATTGDDDDRCGRRSDDGSNGGGTNVVGEEGSGMYRDKKCKY